MAAHDGNKYAAVFDNDEALKEAYESYCAHLAKGKHKKSWCYEKKGYACTWFTMEKYISESKVLDPIQKEMAISKGLHIWEGICEESAVGKNKKANTASLQMVMRNKFGWDKENKKEDEKFEKDEMLDKWNFFIDKSQSSALKNSDKKVISETQSE